MTQLVRTIGKARITITVAGCVDCGTTVSDRWIEDRRHIIVIGDRRDYVTLQCCGACMALRRAPHEYEAPTVLQRRFEVTR
jgi:hypothetical protein